MAHVNMEALVDKLCERLAVETGGVDIYQAAIAKIDDPTIAARLKHFMQEEARAPRPPRRVPDQARRRGSRDAVGAPGAARRRGVPEAHR